MNMKKIIVSIITVALLVGSIHAQMITTNTTAEITTDLPAGVYMITAIVDGQVKTVRVVKAR